MWSQSHSWVILSPVIEAAAGDMGLDHVKSLASTNTSGIPGRECYWQPHCSEHTLYSGGKTVHWQFISLSFSELYLRRPPSVTLGALVDGFSHVLVRFRPG